MDGLIFGILRYTSCWEVQVMGLECLRDFFVGIYSRPKRN